MTASGTDAHLWADKYSGTLDDVFDLQERLSRHIVEGLRITMLPSEDARLVSRPQLSGTAYECYLRARQEMARWTEPALDRAVHHLNAAVEIGGESALLLANLAEVYAAYVGGGFRLDQETRRTTEQYATRALVLDPAMAPAHNALGAMAYMRGDPKQAFVHLRRAMSIGTDDANAVWWFVHAAAAIGRGSASHPFVERMLQGDPMNAMAHLAAATEGYFDGRFESALDSVRVALRLDPGGVQVRYYGIVLSAANRRFGEADALVDLWSGETPEHPYLLAVTSLLSALEGRKAESAELLAKVLADDEVLAGMRSDPAGLWLGVEIYALNGEAEQALEWLGHGLEIGCINYPFLSRLDPWLENIRRDQRFEALMARVKREWEAFDV